MKREQVSVWLNAKMPLGQRIPISGGGFLQPFFINACNGQVTILT